MLAIPGRFHRGRHEAGGGGRKNRKQETGGGGECERKKNVDVDPFTPRSAFGGGNQKKKQPGAPGTPLLSLSARVLRRAWRLGAREGRRPEIAPRPKTAMTADAPLPTVVRQAVTLDVDVPGRVFSG